MKNFNKIFDEFLSEKLVQTQPGIFSCVIGCKESFIHTNHNVKPVDKFKKIYPTSYKRMRDDFFDQVHPY